MTYEKSCGAVVFRRERISRKKEKAYVLIIKHVGRGHGSFPKGHMESGESEKMTAVREVFEETNVSININESFRCSVRYNPRPGTEKEVVYFLAFTKQNETKPRPGEIAYAEWVGIEEAENCLYHDNDKAVLREALNYIKENNRFNKVINFSARKR